LLRKFLLLLLVTLWGQTCMAQEGKDLTIIYTNDVIGEVEPCG
jgi:hypothetical protein